MEAVQTRTFGKPCDDCPLNEVNIHTKRQRQAKVRFHKDGAITYAKEENKGGVCGSNTVFKEATGPRADRQRARIDACDEPLEYVDDAPTRLGRLGIQKQQVVDCPAFWGNPNDIEQVTREFEGEYNG